MCSFIKPTKCSISIAHTHTHTHTHVRVCVCVYIAETRLRNVSVKIYHTLGMRLQPATDGEIILTKLLNIISPSVAGSNDGVFSP